jgi:hypothetical protein
MKRLTSLAWMGALFVVAPPASAQEISCDDTESYPCGYQLKDVELQRVPQRLKFQARVSQAKLPIGKGTFATIVVKLLRGANEVLCSEQFANVTVADSVLNLSIGSQMNCELDEVIAENTDLAFQVCLGSASNCLEPIELASTPYAIKASFATTAQTAHTANLAAQSHYAHRATADRDLQLRRTLGTGYFDFYTHAPGTQGALYSDDEYAGYADGGFIQWTPVRDRSAKNLHIVGKSADTDAIEELDLLVLGTEHTTLTGSATLDSTLAVLSGGAQVTGDSAIVGTLLITKQTKIEQGGLYVMADGAHLKGNSDLVGSLAITGGGLSVEEQLTVSGGMLVDGAVTFKSPVVFEAGTSVTGEPPPIPNKPWNDGTNSWLFINRDEVSAQNGDFSYVALAGGHGLLLSGGDGAVVIESASQFNGQATFATPAVFNAGLSTPASIEAGTLDVTGTIHAGQVSAGGFSTAGTVHAGTLSVSTVQSDASMGLAANGLITFAPGAGSSTVAMWPNGTVDVTGIVNAAQLRVGGTDVALSNHNHSGVYAGAGHNHDGVYAGAGHGHSHYHNVYLLNCYWSGWQNDFDAEFVFSCPDHYVIAGEHSYHSNGPEDRRFEFKCCSLSSQNSL